MVFHNFLLNIEHYMLPINAIIHTVRYTTNIKNFQRQKLELQYDMRQKYLIIYIYF
jgi:hypothetical protein